MHACSKSPSFPAFLLLLLLLAATPAVTNATIHHVPADHATIQAAVGAAAAGDTVLVAPGLYVENVKVRNHTVVLASHFILDGDPDTITETIIDGRASTVPDTGSTVLFEDISAPGNVLRGFTIQGGTATKLLRPAGYIREGGGVLLNNNTDNGGNGHVAILDNIIRDNISEFVAGEQYRGAGGLSTWYMEATVERNVFYRNIGQQYAGAIAYNYGDFRMNNNLFVDNEMSTTGFNGAAIWYFYASSLEPCDNNSFQGNTVPATNPVLMIASGAGTNVHLRNGLFDETMTIFGYQSGGFMSVSSSIAPVTIPGAGNIVGQPEFENTRLVLTPDSPGVDEGTTPGDDLEDPDNPGMALYPAQGTTHRDMGANGGPGMPPAGFPGFKAPAEMILTPVLQIVPDEGGSIVYDLSFTSDLPNTVPGLTWWTSVTGPSGTEVGPLSVVNFTHTPFMEVDVNGLTQQVPGTAPNGSYEFNAHIGFYPNPILTSSFAFTKTGMGGTPDGASFTWPSPELPLDAFQGEAQPASEPSSALRPDRIALSDAYPNPFNPATSLTLSLPAASPVSAHVIDITGRRVATLAEGSLPAGDHTLHWEAGGHAAGVYVVQVRAGDRKLSRKVMLLK